MSFLGLPEMRTLCKEVQGFHGCGEEGCLLVKEGVKTFAGCGELRAAWCGVRPHQL